MADPYGSQKPSPWQFSLRSLFFVMTAAAVMAWPFRFNEWPVLFAMFLWFIPLFVVAAKSLESPTTTKRIMSVTAVLLYGVGCVVSGIFLAGGGHGWGGPMVASGAAIPAFLMIAVATAVDYPFRRPLAIVSMAVLLGSDLLLFLDPEGFEDSKRFMLTVTLFWLAAFVGAHALAMAVLRRQVKREQQ